MRAEWSEWWKGWPFGAAPSPSGAPSMCVGRAWERGGIQRSAPGKHVSSNRGHYLAVAFFVVLPIMLLCFAVVLALRGCIALYLFCIVLFCFALLCVVLLLLLLCFCFVLALFMFAVLQVVFFLPFCFWGSFVTLLLCIFSLPLPHHPEGAP